MTILSPDLPEVLTKTQLANYLRVSPLSIIRYENDGAFKHFDRDAQRARLYRKTDVEKYLQSIN